MSQRSEIVGLQYLRGICAVAVVADHASQMATLPKYYGGTILGGVLHYGGAGVDIFFVISGFIITVVALQGSVLSSSISMRSFFAKRFARIVPPMWLAILTFMVIRMIGTDAIITPSTYINAALLIPIGGVEPNHIWTLRHEFIFYLVFAITFLGPRPLRWAMVVWLTASVALSAAILGLDGKMDDATAPGIVFSPVNVEFAAGTLVGIAWLRWPQKSDLGVNCNPLLLLCILSVLIMGCVGMIGVVRSIADTLILSIFGGSLVFFAARIECPDGPFSRLGRLVGNASYAIYLFHPPFIAGALILGSRFAPSDVALVLPATIMGVSAICVILHLIVEKPVIRHVQKWLAPRPAMPRSVVREL